MDEVITGLKKIPPVTRFMALSLVGVTALAIIELVEWHRLRYDTLLVFEQFQLWRLYTSFFLGSPGVHSIFELATLYHTSKHLESGAFASRSSDYAWQVTLAAGTIVAATRPTHSSTFLRSLIACLSYVGSKLAPAGAQTSVLGLYDVPMAFWPYVTVGSEFLIHGPWAAAQAAAGLIVGHCWWWAFMGSGELGNRGRFSRYGQAPSWLVNWFGEGEGKKKKKI